MGILDGHTALIGTLRAFQPADKKEADDLKFMTAFVSMRQKPFDRGNLDAHLTASAIVVNRAATQILLGEHRKLGRWLQLGGHGEPRDMDPLKVALREVREESGFRLLEPHPKAPAPFDIDVHDIPPSGDVAPHKHLDIRYLLVCLEDGAPVLQHTEHREVRWFTWDEAGLLDLDDSLVRSLRKTHTLLCK
jgi:8-oxo-dGTP pyrophosphatase MutT (NUDIX family)